MACGQRFPVGGGGAECTIHVVSITSRGQIHAPSISRPDQGNAPVRDRETGQRGGGEGEAAHAPVNGGAADDLFSVSGN